MDGRPPTNPLDALAQAHDFEYGTAKSFEDVSQADQKFVREAWKQGVMGKVAASMIGTKNVVESAVGPIYPTQEDLANNAATAHQSAYPDQPQVEPTKNLDASVVAESLDASPGWPSLLYKNRQLFDPSVKPGDSLDVTTRSLKLAALAATVAWGRGLSRMAAAEDKLARMVGPEDATTDGIVAQIRSGTGYYGSSARLVTEALARMVRDTVIGPEQGYIFSASLDEQWAYVVLLAVSRKYALIFLKVCYTRRKRRVSYAKALEIVTKRKPARPVNNAIDLMAHFLSLA